MLLEYVKMSIISIAKIIYRRAAATAICIANGAHYITEVHKWPEDTAAEAASAAAPI